MVIPSTDPTAMDLEAIREEFLSLYLTLFIGTSILLHFPSGYTNILVGEVYFLEREFDLGGGGGYG